MKYAVTCLFCFLTFFAKAQKMELNQLRLFIEQPVQTAAANLNKKGWTVHPDLSGLKGHQLYKTFSFGNLGAKHIKALAWLRIHADNGIINQLYYQAPGLAQYNLILEEIKQTGAEKKEIQDIDNGQISTYYVSSDYIYQTITGANSYTVMVTKNN